MLTVKLLNNPTFQWNFFPFHVKSSRVLLKQYYFTCISSYYFLCNLRCTNHVSTWYWRPGEKLLVWPEIEPILIQAPRRRPAAVAFTLWLAQTCLNGFELISISALIYWLNNELDSRHLIIKYGQTFTMISWRGICILCGYLVEIYRQRSFQTHLCWSNNLTANLFAGCSQTHFVNSKNIGLMIYWK